MEITQQKTKVTKIFGCIYQSWLESLEIPRMLVSVEREREIMIRIRPGQTIYESVLVGYERETR